MPERLKRPKRYATRLACLIVLSVPIALAAPSGAQGAWSAPFGIDDRVWNALDNHVAVDPNGNAILVWTRQYGCRSPACEEVRARARSAAGVLGAAETISMPGDVADTPQVVMDSGGNAVFVWRGPLGTVQTRTRSAAGALGPIETLAKGYDPSVALDANGNAVFVWFGPQGYIQTRSRSAAGTLSAVQTLAGPDAVGPPQLAVDPNGNAVYVWIRFDGTTDCGGGTMQPCPRVQTRARSATGALSPTQTLSPAGTFADYGLGGPKVGIDANGKAVYVWRASYSGCRGCIQIRSRSATGTLDAIQTVSPTTRDSDFPRIAVAPNGNAVVVWQRPGGGTGWGGFGCDVIEAIARSPTGALSTAQVLSILGQNARGPEVGIDVNGNAVFAWQSFDSPGCGGTCTKIQARVRSSAGTLGAVQSISAFSQAQAAGPPRLALTPSGSAVVFWGRYPGVQDEYVNLLAATGP
jgi:DNA-binding beta-propeller fold protein YncE